MEQGEEKDLRLKRLFKFRAKKLMERAESLISNHYEDNLEDFSMKEEEEKEVAQDPQNSKKILINEQPNSLSIDLGLSAKCKDEIEEKKGDVTEEEKHKSRQESNKLCGRKRAKNLRNKEELESSLKDFTCTICMDYMVGAKKLQCGHCFCDQCISFWFLREKFCPICKERVREDKNTECNLIDFAVENILIRGSPDFDSLKEDLKSWQNRRTQYLEWKNSHRLVNISIGEKIDVRDTEYIWCTGSIERILKSRYNCEDLYFVHYEGWSRCYDEYIPADSDRIAPHGFYTSRNDIPKYTRHEGPDERVYGNVVEGGNESPRNNRQENNAEDNEQIQSGNDQARPEPSGEQPNQSSNDEEKEEEEAQVPNRTNVPPRNRPGGSDVGRIGGANSALLESYRRSRQARPQSRRGNRAARQGIDEIFSEIIGSYDNAHQSLGNSIIRSIQMRPIPSNISIPPIIVQPRTQSEGDTNQQVADRSEAMTSTAVNDQTQLSEIPEESQGESQEHRNESRDDPASQK